VDERRHGRLEDGTIPETAIVIDLLSNGLASLSLLPWLASCLFYKQAAGDRICYRMVKKYVTDL
jgi:hypothetical protein